MARIEIKSEKKAKYENEMCIPYYISLTCPFKIDINGNVNFSKSKACVQCLKGALYLPVPY